MEFIPYTYLIGWSSLNLWYYGSRYCNSSSRGIANPRDLWVTYFTSSKTVKEMRKLHGEPDVIQIRRTFSTANDATTWEAKVCRRLKVKDDKKFLNIHNGDGKFTNAGISPLKETREKLSKSNKGKIPTEKSRNKMSEAQKARFALNPPMNVVIYNFITKEEALITNLKKFCQERSLSYEGMKAVVSGRNLQHKGWSTSMEPKERRTRAKSYTFMYDGEVVKIMNLDKFCRENGLNAVCMRTVNSGKYKSHQGYTKYIAA